MRTSRFFIGAFEAIIRPLMELAGGMLSLVNSILRPAVRFVSLVFVLAATLALMADLTRWQHSDVLEFRSLAAHLNALAPATLKDAGAGISAGLHPWLWDPVLITILAAPAWLIFAAIAAGLFTISRTRRTVNIFVN